MSSSSSSPSSLTPPGSSASSTTATSFSSVPSSSCSSSTIPKKQNKTKITRNRKYLACDACRKWRRKCEKDPEVSDKCKGCSDREICCETTYIRKPRSSEKSVKQVDPTKFISHSPNQLGHLYPSWTTAVPYQSLYSNSTMRPQTFPHLPYDGQLAGHHQTLVHSLSPHLLDQMNMSAVVQNAYPVTYSPPLSQHDLMTPLHQLPLPLPRLTHQHQHPQAQQLQQEFKSQLPPPPPLQYTLINAHGF